MAAKQKRLFVERDGVLLIADQQPVVEAKQFQLAPGVVGALSSLVEAGYELIIVSNQVELESGQQQQAFEQIQQLLLSILGSQGIQFSDVHMNFESADASSFQRKPQLGMVLDYLKSGDTDLEASAVVGCNDIDQQLAENMGVPVYLLDHQERNWKWLSAQLLTKPRESVVRRTTKETDIRVEVDLDYRKGSQIATGIGFFDHMLEQLSKHGGFYLSLQCDGDTHVDEHHTVEDCALALGEALSQALGDKRGVARYGFSVPMDESSADVKLDLSGRPYFVFQGEWTRSQVGELSTEMVTHFFRSLADSLRATLHLTVTGENCHHMVEGAFKAVAKALGQAIAKQGSDLPSTKGVL